MTASTSWPGVARLKTRVALVTEVDFWLAGAGHRARIQALVRYLGAHVELTVVIPVALEASQKAAFSRAVPGCSLVCLGLPARVSMGDALARLQVFFDRSPQQACIIEYLSLGWMRAAIPPGVMVLVDTHDVASQRDADFIQSGQQPAWQTIDGTQERRRLAVFDRVLAICQPDADVFAAWLGPERVMLVPHAMAPNGQLVRPVAARVLFVGSAYVPNQIGLRWFLESVWPHVAAGGLTLDVVGAAGLMLARPLPPAVEVHGVVADLGHAYAAADICINPVRFGSGLKIKTVEALAYGRPLLTTAHGMRGLQACAGRAFLVADTAEEFATTLLELASRPLERARLADEALRLVRSDFSDEACYGPLLATLNGIPKPS